MQFARRPAGQFMGTGFAVGDGRFVITNAHVLPKVVDANQGEFLAVFVGNGSHVEAHRATVVALDRVHDLSVLWSEELDLRPLELASADLVREGETYAFTGYPLGTLVGIYPVTHRGIVASVTPIAITGQGGPDTSPSARRQRSSYKVYQLDATAYPGNSGSPLYHPESGEVVGVVNKVLIKGTAEDASERPSGITYAIPVMHVHRLLKSAMQGS
jgi:S1-C subfamily serine protease